MSKFSAGQMVITPTAQATFDESFVQSCLGRHLAGDWGDLDAEDKVLNDRGVESGPNQDRLHSSYVHPVTDEKLWVITEHDRSVTTVLLPSDY